MSDPSEIGPDDARILVLGPGAPAVPERFVDVTDAVDQTSHERCCARFVVLDDVVGADHLVGHDRPGGGDVPVALVADPSVAAHLRGAGWTSPIVVEVDLDERSAERIVELRTSDLVVGVVVPRRSPADGGVAAAVERGRILGLLTSALLSGVATVRTDDPVTARRIRAVVAALAPRDGHDARMDR